MIWNFRDRVKELCAIKHTTQKELAEKLGITVQALNNTLTCDNPSVGKLLRISEALGVELAQLFPAPKESRLELDNEMRDVADKASLLDKAYSDNSVSRCPHCGRVILMMAVTDHVEEVMTRQ